MSDTPRVDAVYNASADDAMETWRESYEKMMALARQLERELGVALDAANRSDTIAAERLREIGRVADLVLSLADSPLSLMEHLKPWAERHCTLSPTGQPPPRLGGDKQGPVVGQPELNNKANRPESEE